MDIIHSKNRKEDTFEDFLLTSFGKIWYKIYGQSKRSIPIVIVHGGPGGSHDYLEPLIELSENRPVVFYDQLDCGNSDKPNDKQNWTLEYYADELNRLLDKLNFDKAHLLGQSCGAAIIMEYLLNYKPDNIEGIIFSAPLLCTPTWLDDQKEYLKQLPDDIREVIEKCEQEGNFASEEYQNAMMVFYSRHLCRMNEWHECMNRTFEKLNIELYQYMWGPSEFTVTGTLKDYSRFKDLSSIQQKVLFTCGEFDEAAPWTVEKFSKQVANSKFYVFKGASHEHHLENTEEYLSVVNDFFNSIR